MDALDKYSDRLTDADFIDAPERVRELFEAAPWLALDEVKIGGCMNVSYKDLFALLQISDRYDSAVSAAEDRRFD